MALMFTRLATGKGPLFPSQSSLKVSYTTHTVKTDHRGTTVAGTDRNGQGKCLLNAYVVIDISTAANSHYN